MSSFFKSQWLLVVFGVAVVLVSLNGLFHLKKSQAAIQKKKYDLLFLVVGGVIQGMYASGGPFLVAYVNKTELNKSQARSTLSFLWLILNILFCLKLLSQNQINLMTMMASIKLIPCFVIGAWFGYKMHESISEKKFKMIVYYFLLIAGLGRLFLSLK